MRRYVAGLTSAAALLLGTGLIMNWLIRHNHRSEMGIHFAGVGLGIAGCAGAVMLFTPWLDWREQWFAFTAVGCLLLVPALRWLPPPDTSGLTRSGQKLQDKPPSPLYLRVYQLPGLDGRGNLAFLAIGIGAAPACINWDFIARRTGDLNALILAGVLQVVGILLPVLLPGLWATMLGCLLFGGTFIGMVSLVLTMTGRYYPTMPAKMMGKMTLPYGVAQIIDPAITGVIGSQFANYNAGLYVAAGVMVLGVGLLFVLKAVKRRDAQGASDQP